MLFRSHLKEIKEIYGADAFEDNTMEKIGEDLGILMASDCPAFLKLVANNMKDEGQKDKELTATFLKITHGDFSYFEVKTSSGKIEKIYWFEFFEGSNEIVENIAKYTNKKVEITYFEKEVYKASLKDYVKIKVVKSISLKDK